MNDKLNILIVENESIIARDLEYSIRKFGWQVAGITRTGPEAVKWVKEQDVDAVLMDIKLDGDMDGIEAAAEITRFSNIPIVYLTAYADKNTLHRARITQPHGYVIKPVDEQNLFVTLDMAVYKSRMERTLKEKDKWLSMILDNLDEGLIATDRQGKIRFMNPAAQEYAGVNADDVTGSAIESVLAIINQNSGEPVSVPFNHAMQQGVVMDIGESSLLNSSDGTLITIDGKCVPVIDEQGKISGTMLVFRDITKRKQLEKNLNQARKMEALGALAGGIAHDFNNILAVIQGYLKLSLDQAPQESKIRKYINNMSTATNRATELVKQIISFSHHKNKNIVPIDIREIVEESTRMIRASLPANITVREHIGEQHSYIKADSTHLHQVIMNLCTNAAQAMQDQAGLLEVELKNIDLDRDNSDELQDLRPGSYVCLTISDSGGGIDTELLPRIFEPFFTTRASGGGTGMGLSIVRGIVENYNGQIRLDSEPGVGTSFSIYFPRVNKPQPRSSAVKTPLPKGTETILIVDDEETFVELGMDLISSLGYHVIGFTDPALVIEHLSQAPQAIDLVLLDLIMPQYNGLQLAEQLRAIRQDLPMVLCTGFSGSIDEAKVKQAGINKIVMKPMVLKHIAYTLRELLDS